MCTDITDPETFAAVLAETVRVMSRRTPAPRGFPFFGLDGPEGCGGQLLTRLSEMGIFRHYERVMDLGAGLGGPARWLARERGCRVVGVDRRASSVRAARRLNRRSHLDGPVCGVVAPPDRLPFRDGAFTHAWSVEPEDDTLTGEAVLSEVYRVVRPGGHVGLQLWLTEAELEERTAGLRSTGFRRIETTPVRALRESAGAVTELAVSRIRAELPGWKPAGPPEGKDLFQVFAERPS